MPKTHGKRYTRSHSIWSNMNEKLYTISELAKESRLNSYTITNRLRSGWTIEKILNTPENPKKKGDA
jgi:hypothetical protein